MTSWVIGLFFPVQVEGAHSEKDASARIYVFNHASLFDLFLIARIAPPNSAFLVRQWPLSLPVFGSVMRLAGYVNTEKHVGEEVLRQARTLLDQGINVIVFPEGTRSRTREVGRFRSGAFKLSIQTGAPVTPVMIEGTGHILPPGRFMMRPGRIRMRVLEDVYPQTYAGSSLGHAAMSRVIRERIAACVSL